MAVDQTQRFCGHCNELTLHSRHRFGDGWGCLLTILTAGLFLPIWLIAAISGACAPYRCHRCGTSASCITGATEPTSSGAPLGIAIGLLIVGALVYFSTVG